MCHRAFANDNAVVIYDRPLAPFSLTDPDNCTRSCSWNPCVDDIAAIHSPRSLGNG